MNKAVEMKGQAETYGISRYFMKADENAKIVRAMLLPGIGIGAEGRPEPGIPVEGMEPAKPSVSRWEPSRGD